MSAVGGDGRAAGELEHIEHLRSELPQVAVGGVERAQLSVVARQAVGDGFGERGAQSVEVRRRSQDAYNEALQDQLDETVWNSGGCRSWYRDSRGRNFTLWPTHTFTFRRQTRRFDAEAYELRARATTAVPATV